MCDVFRPSGPHSPLVAKSPYDTSLSVCHISSGFGARSAVPFFCEPRGWGLRQLWLNTCSMVLTGLRCPLLLTSGFDPPPVERNIGPEYSNEVARKWKRSSMGSLSQDMVQSDFRPSDVHVLSSKSAPLLSENNSP